MLRYCIIDQGLRKHSKSLGTKMNKYDVLERNTANYVPLSPISFLERTAAIYPNRQSVVYNDRSYNWSETHSRCCSLASALTGRGIGQNDTVSVLLHNTPEMFEAVFELALK